MKLFKVLFVCLILALIPTVAKAWKNIPHTLTYDSNFNPVITVTPKNESNKTITTIEFVVVSRNKFMRDVLDINYNYDHIQKNANMSPYASQTFVLNGNFAKDYELYGVYISRVRYSDGTIKEF